MSKKGINRLIREKIVEIIFISLVVVLSYVLFSSNNLSEAASVAREYTEHGSSLQSSFARSEKDIELVESSRDLIDRGSLSIKNPNETSEKLTIYLVVDEDTFEKDFEIKVDGNIVKRDSIILNENGQYIQLMDVSLDSYEQRSLKIEIVGDSMKIGRVDYQFEISKSF